MSLRIASKLFGYLAVLTIAPFITLPSEAHADAIGEGYFCQDGTIVDKKGKEVKISVAKNKIQSKINALGNSKKAKAQKAKLKLIKAALASCIQGGSAPSGPIDVAGTYTGTLTLTSATGKSSQCTRTPSITEPFLVEVEGATVKITGAINPFHIPISGGKKGAGYELTGTNGSIHRIILTVNISNVTDATGDFTAAITAQEISAFTGKFVTVCESNYSGSGFARAK